MLVRPFGNRRNLVIPGNQNATLEFCVEHFIATARLSIADHGNFFVALSGGSTPKAIFEKLTESPYREKVEWDKVHLFWSDERAVPPDHPDSNYHMAMQAGLKNMGIPSSQIHRMVAEENLESNAVAYELQMKKAMEKRPFDLIMLGMGDDGHTASLFPNTEGLKVKDRDVIANYVAEKQTWRMTLTFPCINAAAHIVIYIIGSSKKEALKRVLQSGSEYPVLEVGTPQNKALWIVDEAAGSLLGES